MRIKQYLFLSLTSATVLMPFSNIESSNSENLINEFNSQVSATWDNAQYENITESLSGKELFIRYFVDKNSNIYKFQKVGTYNFGPSLVGNLKEKRYSQGNTCFFGTNYDCLSNVTETTYQYLVKDGKLFEFSRTEYLNFGTKGEIKKTVLGTKRNSSSNN